MSRWAPLSVRTGGPGARFGWWLRCRREDLALRLAPWLTPPRRHRQRQQFDERNV